MGPRVLKVGVAGLGRMGKRHASNFLKHVHRAELVAVFSPDPAECAWAVEHLEPHGVTVYSDYNDMIKHDDLMAVVIATTTSMHAEEAIEAFGQDLHVLCEKPLSTQVDICRQVVEAANKKPHLKVMCGFTRRFDDSYRDAYVKTQEGKIGKPVAFKGQTCDKYDPSGFLLTYAASSGGIFVDTAIHDIDLTLWFFGNDTNPRSIVAKGIIALQHDLKQYSDCDNAFGIVEFQDGRIANYFCSRTMFHGQEDTTEIMGTKGKLSINTNPQKNLVTCYHEGGITREIPHDYWGRFEAAFVKESIEFTNACLDDTPLPMRLQTAVKAVEIAACLQEALITGKEINFDKNGRRL